VHEPIKCVRILRVRRAFKSADKIRYARVIFSGTDLSYSQTLFGCSVAYETVNGFVVAHS